MRKRATRKRLPHFMRKRACMRNWAYFHFPPPTLGSSNVVRRGRMPGMLLLRQHLWPHTCTARVRCRRCRCRTRHVATSPLVPPPLHAHGALSTPPSSPLGFPLLLSQVLPSGGGWPVPGRAARADKALTLPPPWCKVLSREAVRRCRRASLRREEEARAAQGAAPAAPAPGTGNLRGCWARLAAAEAGPTGLRAPTAGWPGGGERDSGTAKALGGGKLASPARPCGRGRAGWPRSFSNKPPEFMHSLHMIRRNPVPVYA